VQALIEDVAVGLGVDVERLSAALDRGRSRLFEARERRVKPGRDEKVLTAWNGMMLRAFAEAAAALDHDGYLQTAIRNAEFVTRELGSNGRLLRTWKDGKAKLTGYLEDHACYADGLIALYEATFDLRWLDAARQIADVMLDRFVDHERGGFYDTASDHEQLVTRPKDLFDNATPSGNSVAADALLRLALLTDDARYREAADSCLRQPGMAAVQYPTGFGRLLCALDFALGRPREIVIVGPLDSAKTRELRAAVFGRFLPNRVVAGAVEGASTIGLPLLADRTMRGGEPTAYVCEGYVCQAPVTDPTALAVQLDGRS